MPPATRADSESNYPYSQELRRQLISFSFYKVMPEWRRLPRPERDDHRHEAAEVLRRWSNYSELRLITYSTVGLRSDSDFVLWRICYSLECLQTMTSELLATRLGGYLQTSYSYLAMTKRSQYQIGPEHEAYDLRGAIKPGTFKYLFLFPMEKTKAWYALPFEERQRMVHDFIRIMDDFPRVRLNVMYSFGLDDQDFIVAIGSDYPEDVLDMVQRMREAESTGYNQRDTPVFTCQRTTVEDMLERLG
jgi:chlorite dismutase